LKLVSEIVSGSYQILIIAKTDDFLTIHSALIYDMAIILGSYIMRTDAELLDILTEEDRRLLRGLAERVAEIASDPINEQRRQRWREHNGLKKGKPIVLVFPEGAWAELLPSDRLKIHNNFWGGFEWYLRHLIYRWEHMRDDNVIEPELRIPLVYSSTGWGIGARTVAPESKVNKSGQGIPSWASALAEEWVPTVRRDEAVAFDPQLKDPKDIDKLKVPGITYDMEPIQHYLNAAKEVFGDILRVGIKRKPGVGAGLTDTLVGMRRFDQLSVDMYERPQWVHEIMEFMTQNTLALMDYLERNVALDLNNSHDYVGSGGLGYTDELPASGFEGKARFIDLWGHSAAQYFALVSPEMHWEFSLQYEIRILDRYGLNCYGCCEPLTHKFDIAKQIPRLRRVSVSPWADVKIAAQELEAQYIFSWKPNPAQMVGDFHVERVRKDVERVLEVASDCVLEIILKDTHTVGNKPERVEKWIDTVQEMVS
jgi:hypothetical protein